MMDNMQTQHFFAPTMRQAMNLVKQSLGPEAIIYTQKSVPGGIEIEAALEDPQTINKQPQVENTTHSEELASRIQYLQAQMQSLHNAFCEQTNLQRHSVTSSDNDIFTDILQQLDFKSAIIKKLTYLVRLYDDCQTIKQKLTKCFNQVLPCHHDSTLQQGGIISLLGPTGVGKTTTISKLAARFVLHHGSNSLGLITTDCIRVAGREQLSIVANILNCKMMTANNRQQLTEALDVFADKKCVLIDTAGLSPKDRLLKQNLEMLAATRENIQSYLVLSANCHVRALEQAISQFRTKLIKGCIVTKVDESFSLGPILSALITHKLNIAYLSQGQRVPEDLQLAKTTHIVDILLQQHQHTLTEQTQQPKIGEIAHAE